MPASHQISDTGTAVSAWILATKEAEVRESWVWGQTGINSQSLPPKAIQTKAVNIIKSFAKVSVALPLFQDVSASRTLARTFVDFVPLRPDFDSSCLTEGCSHIFFSLIFSSFVLYARSKPQQTPAGEVEGGGEFWVRTCLHLHLLVSCWTEVSGYLLVCLSGQAWSLLPSLPFISRHTPIIASFCPSLMLLVWLDPWLPYVLPIPSASVLPNAFLNLAHSALEIHMYKEASVWKGLCPQQTRKQKDIVQYGSKA